MFKEFSSGESHTCKHTSDKDRCDSDHIVPDPFNPMTKYCEFSVENLAKKMIEANKIGTNGGESEMFIKTEANGIVCKSNPQGFKATKDNTRSHEIPQNAMMTIAMTISIM